MDSRGFFIMLSCSALLSSAAVAQPTTTPLGHSNIPYLAFLLEGHSNLNSTMKEFSPQRSLLQNVQEVCCPGGYPWYRQSTNTCYSSYSDCHDSNGGGWSCRQVNAC